MSAVSKTAGRLASVDPDGPEHYVAHLASLSPNHPVMALADIITHEGFVICRAGTQLGPGLVRHFSKRRLRTPLETLVSVGSPVGPEAVMSTLTRLLGQHPDLGTMHRALGLRHEFEDLLRAAPIPPFIWQSLTVLQDVRPDWFDMAVLGAWWALLMARESNCVDEEMFMALGAGLTRDLGFLHIDARRIDRPGFLEGGSGDWKAIQGHVFVGKRIWQESEASTTWKRRVGTAIQQHHERVNATGYPKRPSAALLEPISQFVGLGDVLAAVRLRRFADSGRNMKDAMPLLMVSGDCFTKQATNAAVACLTDSRLERTRVNAYRSTAELVDHLMTRFHIIRELTKALTELPSFEPVRPKDKNAEPTPMTRAVSTTVQMLLRSGANDGELVKWLDRIRNGKATSRLHELAEIDLQQDEAIWRIEQIRRLLDEYVTENHTRTNSPVFTVLKRLKNPKS